MTGRSESRPCKKCRAQISMIIGPNGKFIPVQQVRTVYRGAIDLDGTWTLQKVELEEAEAYYVSHFETCPDAGTFSKGKKR